MKIDIQGLCILFESKKLSSTDAGLLSMMMEPGFSINDAAKRLHMHRKSIVRKRARIVTILTPYVQTVAEENAVCLS
jgi:hypothetical protein